MNTAVPRNLQTWPWLAFFASFAVKMPMWPVHTWLPDAHVEAPTAGSVMLAAIMLKMGGYGFLRFSLPMFPEASQYFAPLIFTLSVIAIIYTSLVALMQEDMKKLIAYSSVAHMGFVTMGIFAGTTQGVAGGVFQMISHGIVSGALFLCVGVVYDRMHTREIAAYGGLVNRMPLYALVFMVFTMANVGLPGTSGFVGEFLTLLGTFKVNIPIATVGARSASSCRRPMRCGCIARWSSARWSSRRSPAIKDLDLARKRRCWRRWWCSPSCSGSIRSRCSTCRRPRCNLVVKNYAAAVSAVQGSRVAVTAAGSGFDAMTFEIAGYQLLPVTAGAAAR